MRNPYDVLGVAKNASSKEIKSAYRKLAKQYHPDQKPDDPKAKERFAEIGQAYEILGDEKQRGAFDRGEIDAEGKPRFAGLKAPVQGATRLRASAVPAVAGPEPSISSSEAAVPMVPASAVRTFSARFSATHSLRAALQGMPGRGAVRLVAPDVPLAWAT